MAIRFVVLGLIILLTPACGKMGHPLPPEAFAPTAVSELLVQPTVDGVRFAWMSPNADRRGKELKEIDGYEVLRKRIEKPSDVVDSRVEYQSLGFIPDNHLKLLDALRKQARAEGKVSRRVQVDAALKRFEFTDTSVAPGATYLYKIVPLNQDGVEGVVPRLTKVLFRGESSEVSTIRGDVREFAELNMDADVAP